jgi:hypothetical protein
MRVAPKSPAGWIQLLLLPFKVFVPASYVMITIQREYPGYRNDIGANTPFVIYGYLVSFVVLVFGALFLKTLGARKEYLSTCMFIAGLFLFVLLMLPYLAHS